MIDDSGPYYEKTETKARSMVCFIVHFYADALRFSYNIIIN